MKIDLNLDVSVYCLEAIQKASYRFIDRFSVLISQSGEEIHCAITIDEKHSSNADLLLADFQKELLDQQLRHKIKQETEAVRNLILSLVFSKSGLQG